jgi:uncharacterized protein (TIGR02001 family)
MFAGETGAQVSGSATLVSDYRFRGVSLSDEKPAAQLSVAYDHASGWYAGGFASTVQLSDQSDRHLQVLAYAGYARRLGPAWSVEMGTGYYAFSGAGGYDYPEVFCGAASGSWNGRIHYSPNYFALGSHALYAELNGMQPLADHLHLLGHLGLLRSAGRSAEHYGPGLDRFDARAGIELGLERFGVQFEWVGNGRPNAQYPVGAGQHRNSLVLSVSRLF